ncbi:MAG: GntR family transcriptional regulator [Nitratireductor sp.]|uniref:aminotransferase-like domain-containing protein n=1 Tax=Nitratireductor sp. B36 TaxID=2762059 RepID=UPI000C98F3CE|nr:PLP-dependent aminotransferase family protein [Nitratireductor sp. B36]MAS12703.1 GntR family transcriptional regulator [Nitratireductor sp.]MCC5777734.1 PLP-dependent aminotransferase family protein [Nitratireductor sp. B36]
MTNWLPNLHRGSGPLYVRLADQIERDIENGTLPPGTKLPPQRNLAYDVGVTIGTVSRAYTLVRQRGLVSGEVGRGTYVLERIRSARSTDAQAQPFGGTRATVPEPGKTRMDSTAAPNVGQAQILTHIAERIAREHPSDVASYTRALPTRWLEAGSQWLARGDWRPQPGSIVPTLGGHAGILAVIAAMTVPGDRIAFEECTYSHVARSATVIGRRLLSVAIDDEGMVPEDFERVCAQQHPRMVFLVPSLHNPTLATMPEARRHAIVEIAKIHNVWLIEDNIYGALLEETPPLFASLAPERTFHVGSLSKSVAAGVRGGWVASPLPYVSRVLTAHKMITGGIPFLLAELAAQLVLSEEAASIHARVRAEIAARQAIAASVLAGKDFASHPDAPFLWLKLPEPWLSSTFKQAAMEEGVLVDDEDEFKVGRGGTPLHRARIAFTVPESRETVTRGLKKLRSLLDNPISGFDNYG